MTTLGIILFAIVGTLVWLTVAFLIFDFVCMCYVNSRIKRLAKRNPVDGERVRKMNVLLSHISKEGKNK